MREWDGGGGDLADPEDQSTQRTCLLHLSKRPAMTGEERLVRSRQQSTALSSW